MVKYIPDVNSWQLLFVRCMSQLVTMMPIILLGKHHFLGTQDLATRWRVAAQGILGGLLKLLLLMIIPSAKLLNTRDLR